ncbi:MAG: hypothetical protein ACRC92_26995 [Peptostreptococcaceae bacterium]
MNSDTVCTIYKTGIRRVTISGHKNPNFNGVWYDTRFWSLEFIDYIGLTRNIGLARPIIFLDPNSKVEDVQLTDITGNVLPIRSVDYIHLMDDKCEPILCEDYDVFSVGCTIKEEYIAISRIVSDKEEFVIS